MSDLRLNLDDIAFERLFELGRAAIPASAPTWTDHNTHDPGIMLIELMAWIADAQIYALSRTRVDERIAYARLLGLEPQGPRPAHGLVWPLLNDDGREPAVPAWPAGTVVRSDQEVIAGRPLAPRFHATRDIRLTSARLAGVSTEQASGATVDWTRANGQNGATFMPFGQRPRPGDALALRFTGDLVDAGAGADDVVSLGVQLETTPAPSAAASGDDGARSRRTRLQVSIEDADGERPLRLAEDTTDGLSRSGVVLVRAGVEAGRRHGAFRITLRSATGGFLRSPRVHRISANVLPIVQRQPVDEESASFGTGLPDQRYVLRRKGIAEPFDETKLPVRIFEADAWHDWSVTPDLADCGPDDRRFALEHPSGTLSFGNGVNGRAPPPGATLQVSYPVSEGSAGNLPADIRWTITGIAGIFGTNPEPTAGGADAVGAAQLQAAGRERSRQARPVVTAKDLAAAAESFADLGVQRAFEIPPDERCRRVRGTRVLVVVGPRDVGASPDADADAESAEWLEEIRARLAPRLPLGQRLEVTGPRYVNVGIKARLIAVANLDPRDVADRARQRLETRLAIVRPRAGDEVWPFGRAVTPLAVKGWLRSVAGVARVVEVNLFQDDRDTGDQPVAVPPAALPRLMLSAGDIAVDRSPVGAPR